MRKIRESRVEEAPVMEHDLVQKSLVLIRKSEVAKKYVGVVQDNRFWERGEKASGSRLE